MTGPYLIDTDILVDYLRGRDRAVRWLDDLEGPLFISTITIAELYAGVREGDERTKLDEFMHAFVPVSISREIATQAGLFRRDYGRTHGSGLADCVVAASVLATNTTLATLNRRHFPMLERVLTPFRRP